MTQKRFAQLALFLLFGLVSAFAVNHGFVLAIGIIALATMLIAPKFVNYGGLTIAAIGLFIGFWIQGSIAAAAGIAIVVLVSCLIILAFFMKIRGKNESSNASL